MLDNAKREILKHKELYATILVVVLIIISGLVGYKKGYRFQNNFLIGKVGTLSITIPTIQTNIFIDQNRKITTMSDNQTVSIPLSPRSHSVIVSHDGYFPWKKNFAMPSGGNIVLSPIFVTQNATGQIILKNDPEFWEIRSRIIRDILPTKENPRFSTDNFGAMWIEDNAVIVKVQEKMFTVIQPDTVIKNLYFYKDRSDTVVFSTNNSIYVIEVNKEGTQNFIPIYKGKNPYFIARDIGFIYVLDGETLMQVII